MPTSPRTTVLFVEDESPFRKVYQDVLASHGFIMLEAGDGEQGWELITARHPDIILLDMVLPKLSGLDLLKRIRGNPATSGIPVIMLTVLGDEETIKTCLDAGADNYAIKGMFAPSEIVAMVSALLRTGRKPDGSSKLKLRKGKSGRPEVE